MRRDQQIVRTDRLPDPFQMSTNLPYTRSTGTVYGAMSMAPSTVSTCRDNRSDPRLAAPNRNSGGDDDARVDVGFADLGDLLRQRASRDANEPREDIRIEKIAHLQSDRFGEAILDVRPVLIDGLKIREFPATRAG